MKKVNNITCDFLKVSKMVEVIQLNQLKALIKVLKVSNSMGLVIR